MNHQAGVSVRRIVKFVAWPFVSILLMGAVWVLRSGDPSVTGQFTDKDLASIKTRVSQVPTDRLKRALAGRDLEYLLRDCVGDFLAGGIREIRAVTNGFSLVYFSGEAMRSSAPLQAAYVVTSGKVTRRAFAYELVDLSNQWIIVKSSRLK